MWFVKNLRLNSVSDNEKQDRVLSSLIQNPLVADRHCKSFMD